MSVNNSRLILKDRSKRYRYNRFEKKMLILKYLTFYSNNLRKGISTNRRKFFFHLIFKEGKKSSITYIRRRCLITGRARGVLKHFKISRIIIKELNNKGYLTTIMRANR